MSEPAKSERALRITVLVFSVVIVTAMVGVRTCMQAREAREARDAAELAASAPEVPPSARSGAGKSCAVTSRPSGATVLAQRGDERIALGVTPLEVEQGDYGVVLELSGHQSVTLTVGVHDGPCTLAAELPPTPAP